MSAHARVHLPLTWLRWSDESRSESASGEERVVLGWFLDRRMGGLVNEDVFRKQAKTKQWAAEEEKSKAEENKKPK